MRTVFELAREMTNQSDWMKTQMIIMAEDMSATEATLNQMIIEMNELKDRAKSAKGQVAIFAERALVLNDFLRDFLVDMSKKEFKKNKVTQLKKIDETRGQLDKGIVEMKKSVK